MWLFSETGFVSAVQDMSDSEIFTVRGRDRESLEPLSRLYKVKIRENEGTDYPYRVSVSKDQFASWVADQIENLDYTNYKSRMYQSRGENFTEALHDVWEDMHSVSPKNKKTKWNSYL